MIFYIGTTNPYKIREFASILTPLEIPLRITEPIDPEETGETFGENAKLKACEYAYHTSIGLAREAKRGNNCTLTGAFTYLQMQRVWFLSEDSGLVIPALGGLPGPKSARFDDCTVEDRKITAYKPSLRSRDEIDLANNLRVLELMKGVQDREAWFEVCMVIVDPFRQVIFETTVKVEGWITEDMKGHYGFGYDPIFASESSFGKTFAEIDPMRKNLISHRRKLSREFRYWLRDQLEY